MFTADVYVITGDLKHDTVNPDLPRLFPSLKLRSESGFNCGDKNYVIFCKNLINS